MKTALITGVTGQDGSYLSELLLSKDYKVVGVVSGNFNIGYQNIDHIKDQLILEEGDLLDKNSLERIIETHKPDEIYNLAGMTFIPPSWEKPTLTIDVNTNGVARILELISGKYQQIRFYQASSSKIFGNPEVSPQNEQTPILPQDPYSISKAAAHNLVGVMRSHFDLFTVSGIMFNHESERRGPEFVTRKITQTAVKIKAGQETELKLGDLDAVQDWGYAPDYVEAMWLMLQADKPDDYVIGTGETHSVREFVEEAFKVIGIDDWQSYVKSNTAANMRPAEVDLLVGNPQKAMTQLNWKPKVDFKNLVKIMVEADLEAEKKL